VKYHVVIIYDYTFGRDDYEYHLTRIEAEDAARADGHQIMSDDGNGFLTYVSFEDAMAAIEFKLKYL
jgi:hypothetical protein